MGSGGDLDRLSAEYPEQLTLVELNVSDDRSVAEEPGKSQLVADRLALRTLLLLFFKR
jgi:hypothetical protein